MNSDPWIPVDEMLPEPGRLVWVWTNWTPPDGETLQYCATMIDQGFIDESGHWHVRMIGVCGAVGTAASERAVLFWQMMPPPPPGHHYPHLRNGVHPAGRNAITKHETTK